MEFKIECPVELAKNIDLSKKSNIFLLLENFILFTSNLNIVLDNNFTDQWEERGR